MTALLAAPDRFAGRVTVRVVTGGPVTPTSLPLPPAARPRVDIRGGSDEAGQLEAHRQVLRRRTLQVA